MYLPFHFFPGVVKTQPSPKSLTHYPIFFLTELLHQPDGGAPVPVLVSSSPGGPLVPPPRFVESLSLTLLQRLLSRRTLCPVATLAATRGQRSR